MACRASLALEEGSQPGAAADALRSSLQAATVDTSPATTSQEEARGGAEEIVNGALAAQSAHQSPHAWQAGPVHDSMLYAGSISSVRRPAAPQA